MIEFNFGTVLAQWPMLLRGLGLTVLNEILLAAKADGTLEKYSQKWLGRGTGVLPE